MGDSRDDGYRSEEDEADGLCTGEEGVLVRHPGGGCLR